MGDRLAGFVAPVILGATESSGQWTLAVAFDTETVFVIWLIMVIIDGAAVAPPRKPVRIRHGPASVTGCGRRVLL